MSTVLVSEKIDEIFLNMKTYKEKEIISEEENINQFLDSVLIIQKTIRNASEKLEFLVNGFEELTWFDIQDDILGRFDDLLISAEDLHRSAIQNYIYYRRHRFVSKVANTEIKIYKCVIDDFKDSIQDLRLLFFNREYIELMNKLTERNQE